MPNQKMNHNPIECAKCRRGKTVKIGDNLYQWHCCKINPYVKDEEPDLELLAVRADKRQMGLPL